MLETNTELTAFSDGICAALSNIERLRSRIADAAQDIHELRIRHELGYDYEDELLEASSYVGSAATHIQYVIDELAIIAEALKTREDA